MSYDLHIEGSDTTVAGVRFMTFGDYARPQGVQGIQKMVNLFLKCLCTPKGSDLSDKKDGFNSSGGCGRPDTPDQYQQRVTRRRTFVQCGD
jgi:hypothetical protein